MAEIKLFEHNEKGYEGLVESLKDNNLSIIEHATGTGKSYILIKYMAEQLKGKRVLFVTLHNHLFKQLVERDMPRLGTSKDELSRLSCVLYANISKHSAEWYLKNYDAFIFDEAHHCGADKWGSVIGEIRDFVRTSDDKQMIGATATSVRYLDDYLDVAQEYFDGNVASKLYLSEAILKEILPTPYYINVNTTSLEKISEINRKLNKLRNLTELDELRKQIDTIRKKVEKETDKNSIFKKHDVKKGEKYIVFCSSIEDIEIKKKEAEYWFKGIAPIETYSVHSGQRKKTVEREIDNFSNNNNKNSVKLMFAVDMFNEGSHIDGLDGVIMTRRTSSPIVYLQQVGRALSYSTRKKQIKIFDFVGNATDINVINNLYKELIATARQNLNDGIGDSTIYQNVIDRFKIIDEGNKLIGELNEVNDYLQDTYFVRGQINKYIAILENYIRYNRMDFMEALKSKKVDMEHRRIYNELRKVANVLSYDDLTKLKDLGIILTDYQNDDNVLEQIKQHGSYKNAKNVELSNFMKSYNTFYLINNRRPSIETEKEMALKYREYLYALRSNEIKEYLKKSDYKLTVEELIILKDYPSKEDINEYLDDIERKYKENIPIDDLERLTVSNIEKLMSFKDRPMLKTLCGNKDMKLNIAIDAITVYLESNPDEKFEDIEQFSDQEIYSSLKLLYRYKKFVTNKQFELLKKLNIKLPDLLDISLEQRKEMLDGCNSIFEKEESDREIELLKIKEFIGKERRLPKKDDEIYQSYSNFLVKWSQQWREKLYKAIKENDIPLSLDEKVIFSQSISRDDLLEIKASIFKGFRQNDFDHLNISLERKKIKVLKERKAIGPKLYKILYKTYSAIEYIKTCDSRRKTARYVINNQVVIPYLLLPYIEEKCGLKLDNALEYAVNNKNTINIAHAKYLQEKEAINKYIEYIKENGKRPDENDLLTKQIEHFLVISEIDEIRVFFIKIQKEGIKLTPQEIFLAGFLPMQKQKELYEYLDTKLLKDGKLNEVDSFVHDNIRINLTCGVEINIKKDSLLLFKEDEENKRFDILKQEIEKNPSIEVKNDAQLTRDKLEELREYKEYINNTDFLNDLLNKIKTSNESYQKILNEEELSKYLSIKRSTKSDYKDLISQIEELSRNVAKQEISINLEEAMEEYLEFVKQNGHSPSSTSENTEEKRLSDLYDLLILSLDKKELKNFKNSITRNIELGKRDDFFMKFTLFIEANHRFPTILSENEYEVSLAKEYTKIGSKLLLEKRLKINKLRTKYLQNTIEFAKKGGN